MFKVEGHNNFFKLCLLKCGFRQKRSDRILKFFIKNESSMNTTIKGENRLQLAKGNGPSLSKIQYVVCFIQEGGKNNAL